ncbi:MAG: acyl-CoA dehydrogenase family protein [Cyclobacteriaceae bacterium]
MSDNNIKGGQFLISDLEASNMFIPEEWSEEQNMMAQTCKDFVVKEVHPILDRIDSLEEGLMPSLLEKSAELGLLGISVPENYGGFGADFNTSLYTSASLGHGHSFAVALMAHTGIGMLPILYFGTEEQKQKYVPKMASGEMKASYCLTEPDSGSDAMAAKTKAVLTDDGKHYVLNGQKMWITNAGFADVFVVFAKIDGEHFTAFIVEKGAEGLSMGNEEHKMGIKGSSTRQVFFNDVKIPVENLLGEIGKGHYIAFGILNIGRIKLCAATLGAAKQVAQQSINYSTERKQFKKSLNEFGAIKYKIAQQAIRVFAVESSMYRAGADIGAMEHALQQEGKPFEVAVQEAAKEFAIECAITKVIGSEMLDYVVDEGVQIYGGMGFSADAPMDRSYRDSRINRIFEGTNEINRLLTVDMFLKRAMKGEIDLMTPAMAVQKELMGIPEMGDEDTSVLGAEKKAVKNMKKAILMVAGAAVQKLMAKLQDEQEILMNVADMINYLYQAESIVLRTEKVIATKGEGAAATHIDMTKVFIYDAMFAMNKIGNDAITSFAEGDELKMMSLGLKRFTKVKPVNVKEIRRRIADGLVKANDLTV